jgi:hypothetical protein
MTRALIARLRPLTGTLPGNRADEPGRSFRYAPRTQSPTRLSEFFAVLDARSILLTLGAKFAKPWSATLGGRPYRNLSARKLLTAYRDQKSRIFNV